MMTKLVPKLRFSGFSGEWEEKKLGKICNINPTVGDLPNSFIYIDLESVVAGKLLIEKKILKKYAPSRAQRLLKHGDVIYQMVRPYQKNNLFYNFSNSKFYVASTGYAQLRASDSSSFLYQLIHIDDFVNKVLEKSTGSNYPAINSKDLSKITVQIPQAKEQQEIANCLSSLDNLIEVQNKKVEALAKYKKGLMQKLFATNDEKIPKLRFKGFSGEWEEKNFEEIFVRIASKKYQIKSDKYLNNGTFPVIDQGKSNIIAYSNEKNKLFKNNAIIVFGDHTRILKYIDFDFIVGADGTQLIKTINKYNNKFFYYQLLKTKIPNTGYNRHFSFIKDMLFYLPNNIKEQKKIADSLNSLDNLIEVQNKNIQILKTHKKGLMQQLFVSENK
jgi:type I restriction enzyme S subunit